MATNPCQDEINAKQKAYKDLAAAIRNHDNQARIAALQEIATAQTNLDTCNANKPFPTPTTNVGQAMVTLGDYTYWFVVESLEGRILYSKWKLGDAPSKWHEVGGGGNGRTDAAPAAAVVEKSNYIFISIKEPVTGNLRLNQGLLNPSGQDVWVGWL